MFLCQLQISTPSILSSLSVYQENCFHDLATLCLVICSARTDDIEFADRLFTKAAHVPLCIVECEPVIKSEVNLC